MNNIFNYLLSLLFIALPVLGWSQVDTLCAEMDSLPPTLMLNEIEFVVGFDGQVPILIPDDFVNLVEDNCPGEIEIQPQFINLTCEDVGINLIPITATDPQGNSIVDTFQFTILDLDAPLVLCPAPINAFGCDTIIYSDPFLVDNCGIDSLALIQGLPSGTVFPPGITLVQYMANDPAGNSNSCSFEVNVDVGISLNIATFEVSCAGGSDGAVVLIAQAESGIDSINVLNHSGDLTQLTGGTYYVEIIDSLGCSLLDTFIIEEPSALSIDTFFLNQPSQGSDNGSIDIDVSGGNQPYTFIWMDGTTIVSQDEDPSFLGPGCYTVTIMDAFGCILNSQEFKLGETVSTLNINEQLQIQIAPNPASDFSNISLANSVKNIDKLELIDLRGNTILNESIINESYNLNTSHIPNGLYILKLTVGEQIITEKLIISHL